MDETCYHYFEKLTSVPVNFSNGITIVDKLKINKKEILLMLVMESL